MKIFQAEIDLIKESGLFDTNYYLKEYPDVARAGMDPIKHYLVYGATLLRRPSEKFDTKFYLESNPDVAAAKINPLLHYIEHGMRAVRGKAETKGDCKGSNIKKENRVKGEFAASKSLSNIISCYHVEKISSMGLFEKDYYLEMNSDIKRAGIDPFTHYLEKGYLENRPSPSRKYDFNKYYEIYPDVRKNKINPILHYVSRGIQEGRRLFLSDGYVRTYNGQKKVSPNEYYEYKSRRGLARFVVYTTNFNANNEIHNPECINPDYDYIYFGVKGSENAEKTVWEHKVINFYINDLGKLFSFCCYNSNILLPEYANSIWVVSTSYLNSKNLKKIEKNLENGVPRIVVSGEIFQEDNINYYEALNDFKKSISENVFTEDVNLVDIVKPNYIVRNESSIGFNPALSLWWQLTLKHDFDFGIPVNLIGNESKNLVEEKFLHSLSSLGEIIGYRNFLKNYYIGLVSSKFDFNKYRERLNTTKVTIIIPVFNALSDLEVCLSSIESSTFNNYDVILADDCSEQNVLDWMVSYCELRGNITLLNTDINLGYTKNINRAITFAKEDFIILLNSDTIVTGSWIEKLLICFFEDSSVGISGPLSNAAGWQSVPHLRNDNTIPAHLDLEKINNKLENESTHPCYPISDLINGFCMCISNNVFSQIGLFDEVSFPSGYGEEDDFCMRARANGFKNVVSTATYVFHSKSKSFGHERRLKLATAGRAILDSKYGKDGYKLLTDSIGLNPILEVKRDQLCEHYKLFKKQISVIGEEIGVVSTDKCLINVNNPKICVHLHLFYHEMASFFSDYLKNIPYGFDLIITTNQEFDEQLLRKIFAIDNINKIIIHNHINRGRDILPFIKSLKCCFNNYDFLLHIHSKKSIHNSILGVKWLSHIMNHLLYNSDYVKNIIGIFNTTDIGLIFPPVIEDLYPNYKWGNNKEIASKFLESAGIDSAVINKHELVFPAGNMFWGKSAAFVKLFNSNIEEDDFPEEPIGIDGTLAHALERCVFYIVKDAGFGSLISKPASYSRYYNEIKMLKEKFISGQVLEDLILEKIRSKSSFALIRYYDGEGAFYKANYWDDNYVIDRMSYYFGRGSYGKNDAINIKKIIIDSIEDADVVGMPDFDVVDEMLWFTDQYADGNIEKLPYIKKRYNSTIDCNSAWRILSSLELAINRIQSQSIFCSKDIHYNMIFSGSIYRIMGQVKELSIITSQPVGEYIERLFGIKVHEYLVPQRAIDNDSMMSTRHYPEGYYKILDQLDVGCIQGRLFLVGAGPLGKGYCQKIKSRGGIALDIGAIFDSWINFHTRPEHSSGDGSRFDERLLLTSDNIRSLTYGKVLPKQEITKNDLPNKKMNENLRLLYRVMQ